jgi:hypothetical protein
MNNKQWFVFKLEHQIPNILMNIILTKTTPICKDDAGDTNLYMFELSKNVKIDHSIALAKYSQY